MLALSEFLDHGTLPFVGREAEVLRITGFWRGAFEATELRAILLLGEAGIGKSRLLEHVMRQLVEMGGSVVHVKLYPESATTFLSLVAHALRHPDAARSILPEEPEPKLGPVGAAMRRLSRLRPTLFVVEDLHLLGGESLPAFTGLLKLLADETISLLCVARPVELEARGALEPYLVEELLLRGLDREECAGIWEKVAGAFPDPEVAMALHDATAGNPLALRSALRGALKPGDSVHPGRLPRWSGSDVTGALVRTLKRSVGLLADGMVAHLRKEEVRAARLLAMLGEVFSREAAAEMLGETASLIDVLLFKGIIATTIAPPDPLPGVESAHAPLGFTHTLLHRQLIDNVRCDVGPLVLVIARHAMYSIVPFRLLSEQSWSAPLPDAGTIMRAFDRTIGILKSVDRSSQWKYAEQTWKVAVSLLASRMGAWTQADWERMLVRIAYHKLNIVRREPLEVNYRWLEYLSSITAAASSDELVEGQLNELAYRGLLHDGETLEFNRTLWEKAEKIIESRPHLRFTFAYTDFVIAVCIKADIAGDVMMMRRIRSRVDELVASSGLPDQVRAAFVRSVRPPLLSLYETEEELGASLAQVAEFERTVEKSDIKVWMFCINVLAEVAVVDVLERICDGAVAVMSEQGMMDLLAYTMVRRQRVLAGAHDTFSDAAHSLENALEMIPEWRREQIGSLLAIPIIDAALLRGEPDRAWEILERHSAAEHELQAAQWILLALGSSDPRSALMHARGARCREEEYASLIDLMLGAVMGLNVPVVEAALRAPILRLADIVKVRAITGLISMIEEEGASGSIPSGLLDAAGDAVVRSLGWLAASERKLFAYMSPIIERDLRYLTARQVAAWRKKLDELAGIHARKQQIVSNGRFKLSMFGTITAWTPGGEQLRFQGARARMLLAVMVANQMLRGPLPSAEFCRLAAGGDTIEIESARDIVKTTVYRIRDVLGRDAVLTDGGTPRLNPERVEVDLLEARRLLERALSAMRHSSPMQAKAALIGALEIFNGEVPFPSLYTDFVEVMREDFENELRTTALDVAQALSSEGGMEDAAEILRHVGEVMPGDEEVMERHREILLRMGRHVEAERVRRKAEMA